MATDLFLEMAELPATGSLGTGQSDTRDLLVAGVRISISPKYLYLYLALKVLTSNLKCRLCPPNPPTQMPIVTLGLLTSRQQDKCLEINA